MVIFHGFYQKMATEMNEIVGLPIEHGEFAWFLLVDQRVNIFFRKFLDGDLPKRSLKSEFASGKIRI